jgi:hypothetical protein
MPFRTQPTGRKHRSYILSEKPEHLLRAIPSSEKRVLPESEGKEWLKRNSFNVPEGKIVSAQQLGRGGNCSGISSSFKDDQSASGTQN